MADFHQLRSLRDESSATWSQLNQIAEELAKYQPTAPLPSLDHLKYSDFEQVYEPSDDTYLLLDALLYEFTNGSFARLDGPVLEIGCGSGVPSVFFRTRCDSSTISFATDINEAALVATKKTAAANKVNLHLVRCDLASSLVARLAGTVSVIIFNPPYVPTDDDEVGSLGIEAAWAGGKDGRRVIDRFIGQCSTLLQRPRGIGYLVTVDDNRPEDLARVFRDKELSMKPLFRRRAHNEFLTIQKITWIT